MDLFEEKINQLKNEGDKLIGKKQQLENLITQVNNRILEINGALKILDDLNISKNKQSKDEKKK